MSFRTSPVFQKSWNRLTSCSVSVLPPTLKISGGIPSGSGAMPVCRCSIALTVSAFVGGPSRDTVACPDLPGPEYYRLHCCPPFTAIIDSSGSGGRGI